MAQTGQNIKKVDILSGEGLDFSVKNLDNGMTIALITLPPPQAVTEAYFVALCYFSKTVIFSEQESLAHSFTLEFSSEPSKTILGQWTADNAKHIN